MYREEIAAISNGAEAKVRLLKENPGGYIIMSLLGGIYIGFGVLISFTLGGQLQGEPYAKLVMAIFFSIALSLINNSWGRALYRQQHDSCRRVYEAKSDASRCPQDICHMLARQRYRFGTSRWTVQFDRSIHRWYSGSGSRCSGGKNEPFTYRTSYERCALQLPRVPCGVVQL